MNIKTLWEGRTAYKDQDQVVWNEGGVNVDAWTDGGSRAFFLTEEEKRMKPEDLIVKMIGLARQDIYRCSACGVEMKKEAVAGWPLFAGVACPTHWAQHQQSLKDEAARGNVCRFCRQPYGNCCC